MIVRCGLCGHKAENWEEHIAGGEHQANLKNPERMRNARMQHFLAEQKLINKSYERR